ncbi:MAG: ADP-ribosylation factor-like protein [Candidatus Jordarchaeales archaeon]
MKISLIGLAGSGKTSIYLTTFAGKKPQETKGIAPTVMYEVRRHPFLGLDVSLFAFGGQEQYIESYLEDPKVFAGTDILIPVIDLHDPGKFEEAKNYFQKVLNFFKKEGVKPAIYVFFHKYDVKDYAKELLEKNLSEAKRVFSDIFDKWGAKYYVTSIYEQERLAEIFRDILVAHYEELQKHLENAQKQLAEIPAKVIISDTAGNVIVHNVQGVSTGLQLRADLRDFITACNNLRENFFMVDSAVFTGKGKSDGKELVLSLFKYIIAVLIMKSGKFDKKDEEKVETLLKDMEVFADLVVRAHTEK